MVKISGNTFTFYFFEIVEYLNMPPSGFEDIVFDGNCQVSVPISSNQINMGPYGVFDLIIDGINLSLSEADTGPTYPDNAFYKIVGENSLTGTYTLFEEPDVTDFINSLPDCTWEEGDGGCMDLGTCPDGKFVKSHSEGDFDIFWVDDGDNPTVGCVTSWHTFDETFDWSGSDYIGEYNEELDEITVSPYSSKDGGK